MMGTPQLLCVVGALPVHDFLLLGGSNLCALDTTVPLSESAGPADCWSRPPLCPLSLSLCVLLLPAYCFTNNTGPILHSMPSWPSGGVSVIATSLLFSLRAVFPHTNASLEVQQRVFHLRSRENNVLLFIEDSQMNNVQNNLLNFYSVLGLS